MGGTVFSAQLMINNEAMDASEGATFERIDPLTGDIATIASAGSVADMTRAANAAAAAFPDWSQTGPGERRRLLNAAADILEARTPELIAAMTGETGATAQWAAINCGLGADILREAAAMTTQISGELIPSGIPGSLAMAVRQPAGVCVGIAPWNAPIILGTRAVAMPLACGNTVVLKASELCPKTHGLIGDVLRDAGFPRGVVNVVSNAPSDAAAVVDALIAHPAVRRINFTGSTRVGRIIAESAARHLKRCLLELGGKAPFIVLADADIDEAVSAAAFGAFMNQGQICMSTERIILMDEIADGFVGKFRTKAATLVAGNPRDGNTPLGTLINTEAVRRVRSLVDDALQKGAVLVCGGLANGTLMDATVIDHVTPAMRIYREESFGPVAAIVRVGSVDEAVTVANDNEYGLSAAVFSADVNAALAVAMRLESGICHINEATVSDEPQMPFGGVKSSGYGRFGGKAAIDEFTELRWITMTSGKRHYPI
ncbi:aldehyde dehydrogenase (plasmid) [Rhizobium leguminosarum bv. viciae 248]|uniref:aldehyde dehydrogenase n=1 Tax=Rhizobium leguminosarum TaxID=384 RepID=UPI000378B4D2|nr:aldehyde dehydrogenase [Rhizobium leguminosarum]MCA2406645.1 aldehyde dehydrogenase [Rhizobium leguminosarum]NKM59465.1 aldehyde dehydrogenase family protein [Rhizobium leguminosarum bv. viciae]QHW27978.1 aldehyde dehydrogenase [Rhizobium leguminosarum bv. viciae 248]